MQSFQNFLDRLCLVKAEMRCDKEPNTLDVANALVRRMVVSATPEGSKGSLGRRERANLTIQGQLRAFRDAVPSEYKTEIGPEHMLMSWMVRNSAWVANTVQEKDLGERHIVVFEARTTLEKLCHLERSAWDETSLKMESN